MLNFLSCRYFQQRGWHLLEGKFVNKGDHAIGGNIHTPIDHTHLHVFVSLKIYFKHTSYGNDFENPNTNNTFSSDDIESGDIVCKGNYNPDPYKRPGQKKQGRENKNKSRNGKNWNPRNNRRDGKPAMPKKHTPGSDHRKFVGFKLPIEIFER